MLHPSWTCFSLGDLPRYFAMKIWWPMATRMGCFLLQDSVMLCHPASFPSLLVQLWSSFSPPALCWWCRWVGPGNACISSWLHPHPGLFSRSRRAPFSHSSRLPIVFIELSLTYFFTSSSSPTPRVSNANLILGDSRSKLTLASYLIERMSLMSFFLTGWTTEVWESLLSTAFRKVA